MDYPIQFPGQLASHLRALRRSRGLSQAKLGALLGVGQTRIARIERNPAAISVSQLIDVLSALGVQVVLRPAGAGPAIGAAPAASRGNAAARVAARRRHTAPPGDEPW